jgi:hypothetical protein
MNTQTLLVNTTGARVGLQEEKGGQWRTLMLTRWQWYLGPDQHLYVAQRQLRDVTCTEDGALLTESVRGFVRVTSDRMAGNELNQLKLVLLAEGPVYVQLHAESNEGVLACRCMMALPCNNLQGPATLLPQGRCADCLASKFVALPNSI